MPIINKGTSFSNGEQLTADKINNLLDRATFDQSATDSASTTVNSASQIIVRDSGITTAKLATDAVETAKIKDANVTTAKIADANVTFAKLTDVIDSDTMTGASATTLATSESIKAYADAAPKAQMKVNNVSGATYNGEESVTFPNGLTMKFGSLAIAGSSTVSIGFNQNFTSGILSVMLTLKTSIPNNNDYGLAALSQTTSGFNLQNGAPGTETISWMAIGF